MTEAPEVVPGALGTPGASGRALRGGLLRGAGYAGGILLTLASAPLLVRHLGVVGFGQYVTAVSIATLVVGFTEGGLNAIALRGYSTLDGAARDKLMGDVLGIRLALSIAGCVGAIGFTAIAGYGSTLVLGVSLACVGAIFQLMQSILSVPLQGELTLGRAALVDLARQVVSVSLIVALVLAGASLVELLAVAIPASGVSLALAALLVRRLTPLRPTFHPREWWPLMRDSILYAAAIAVNVVYFRMAVVLTSLLASDLQTGYFVISFRIIEALIGVPGLVIGAVFPILARAERDDQQRFAVASGRLFELSVLAGMLMVVVLEVAAPFAIDALTGHETGTSVVVLRIQALAMVATFSTLACAYPLLILRRYRELLVSNVLALTISSCLIVVLVGPLGARGAAIGTAIGETGLAVVVAWMLVRSSPEVRLPLSTVGVAVVAGLLAVGVGLTLPMNPILQTLSATLVYLGALHVTGRLPRETVRLLQRRRAIAR